MEEKYTISDIFGENVFSDKVMQERLPKKVYKNLKKTMAGLQELSMSDADVIAKAMKDWAEEKGATHYTHIFQPLIVSLAAEKHDAFVTNPDESGNMITQLSGKALLMQEPDASSFPSGGTRDTCAARGYTFWDVTSPAYIKTGKIGAVLCIPAVFCSYTGITLDKKAPLLRSIEAVSKEAMRIVKLVDPETEATKVGASVGPEQEYFIIDRDKYLARKDLVFTGRTLFGAAPCKGQELDDQYFGVIPEKVGEFMKDLNAECWKLGITVTTQHNEVAPGQHELAPIYAEANIAVDNNLAVMEIVKKVAERHGLACLLHEKPFAGVNGSGKHNNWSLGTDTGVNLLDPGDNPSENKLFLLTLACIVKGVDTHADLLRQSASDVGNDHRLGAQEAPPAIISIFLGDQLEDIVKQIIEKGKVDSVIEGGKMNLGISTVTPMKKDATDRNRTSPFAFTGNKFEFRMVGSNDSISAPNTTLNAIVAEAFSDAADEIEAAADKDAAIDAVIRKYLTEHQRVIFNGNGYSDEWVAEAEKRGLPNIKSMVDATETLTTDKAIKLFGKFGIMNETELKLREEVLYETYAKVINIEAQTMIDMAQTEILPAVMAYAANLAASINEIQAACEEADVSYETDALKETSALLAEAKKAVAALKDARQKAADQECPKCSAHSYHDDVMPAMAALRAPVDKLETIVDKDIWPIPTYADMLFEF
ncbi:MAG: glutamine synthetase III [[Bacteroides] pectinophilus]|nr:glutamine synthetase III [[Bacteroides] pectinophilus]